MRLRPPTGPLLARSDAVSCAACGMLLGGVARRRGACPRCRAPIPPATRGPGEGYLRPVPPPRPGGGWLTALRRQEQPATEGA